MNPASEPGPVFGGAGVRGEEPSQMIHDMGLEKPPGEACGQSETEGCCPGSHRLMICWV